MKNFNLEDKIDDLTWSIPMPYRVLHKLGYIDIEDHRYDDLIYKDYIYYFKNKDMYCGFVKKKNNIMYPMEVTYVKCSEGSKRI